ncbi:MAG: hypothetical protein OEO84_08200 [Betaproteobacteria bacterium]|nr:hypothetical protein [Betaproteobacteria bacterium]MDH5537163.1 hypothetical protein [Betaproteobacteria bacterium]
MSDSTIAILVMLNNLFHDFAVALLFASLLMLSLFYRKIRQHGDPAGTALVRAVAGTFDKVIYACWAALILGGIVRTLAYESFEWNEAAGRGQVAALVVKHIVLVSVVVWGTYIQIRLRKYLKRSKAQATN